MIYPPTQNNALVRDGCSGAGRSKSVGAIGEGGTRIRFTFLCFHQNGVRLRRNYTPDRCGISGLASVQSAGKCETCFAFEMNPSREPVACTFCAGPLPHILHPPGVCGAICRRLDDATHTGAAS